MENYFKEARLLRDLNRTLDGDYQKLSDKYKALKLSHNRKKEALENIVFVIDNDIPGYNPNPMLYMDLLVRIKELCNNALFSDGRCNCRPIVKHKKKGGKDA